MQIAKVRFEIKPVFVPRHAVDPRRGLRTQCPVGRPEAIDIDVMQQRGELRVLVLYCATAHAIQRTWRASPGSVSGARFAGRVSLGQAPSLHRLRTRFPGLVRRLRR
jgi:hypothetical protein